MRHLTPGLLARRSQLLLGLLLLGALAELSASIGDRAEPSPLLVSAAVSLKESLEEITPLYQREHGTEIRCNFGGSGALEQQIEHGAPVDVFIAAGEREMDELAAKGLLEAATRRNLVSNELVIVTLTDSRDISSFDDLARADVRRIAMAEPDSVPAGKYARETLVHLGLWDRLQPKLVFTGDVRQALIDVETGNAEAGLVYDTEARLSSKLRVAASAPAGSHSPILYPAAVVRGSRSDAAGAFLDFLSGPGAQAVFARHGFRPPSRAGRGP
jgi:molybdate transport system substrate-binding protein